MLESRRGGPEGFKDEFVDKAVGGMNHWITAARRGLMCYGFLVLEKPVSMTNHIYIYTILQVHIYIYLLPGVSF